MRKYLKWLPLIGGLLYLGLAGWAIAQSGPIWKNNASVALTSSTSPVALITPTALTSFLIHPRNGSIVVWAYSGATPTAVPTGVMEVPSGGYFGDTSTADYKTPPPLAGQGWAAALTTGSTSVTADSMTR